MAKSSSISPFSSQPSSVRSTWLSAGAQGGSAPANRQTTRATASARMSSPSRMCSSGSVTPPANRSPLRRSSHAVPSASSARSSSASSRRSTSSSQLLLVGLVLALLLGVLHPVGGGVGRRALGRHGVAHEELAEDHRERQPVQDLGDGAIPVLPVPQRHGRRYPGRYPSDRRDRQRPARLEGERRAGAEPGHRDLVELGRGLVAAYDGRGPVGVGAGDLDVEVRVDGADDGLERPDRVGAAQRDPAAVLVGGAARDRR